LERLVSVEQVCRESCIAQELSLKTLLYPSTAILGRLLKSPLHTELSLTVPITNSLAFLFTVLGEWLAEGKLITKDTALGMTMVLAGICLCVVSKT